MKEYKMPIPEPTKWSEGFWKAAKEHKYVIQTCTNCGKKIFYPRIVCPDCWSDKLEWVESSGRGKIVTYTTTYGYVEEKFVDALPYTLALIELDEGVQVFSNIVECKPEDVKIGMEVEVVFKDITEDFSLPLFRSIKK